VVGTETVRAKFVGVAGLHSQSERRVHRSPHACSMLDDHGLQTVSDRLSSIFVLAFSLCREDNRREAHIGVSYFELDGCSIDRAYLPLESVDSSRHLL
jgi:hypothetical protein